MPRIFSLECFRCHHGVAADSAPTVCPVCGGLLLVRYDMDELKRSAKRPTGDVARGLHRYAQVLPEFTPAKWSEAGTPLLRSRHSAELFVKDEGQNPTGSLEDRGMALAVAAAKHYGIRQMGLASQGDSAASLASYAAAAGIAAHVSLPKDVDVTNHLACVAFGATVTLVDGLATDDRHKEKAEDCLDVSDLKEPFRLEGMKTLGYELVEQLEWQYPIAAIYPSGLAGAAMWKAFEEMEQMGWVTGRRPRLYGIGKNIHPLGMNAIEESGGRVVEIRDALPVLLSSAKEEGFMLSLDGAAGMGVYQALLANGELSDQDVVVLINGRAGWKDAETIARRSRLRLPSSLPVGGIITPQ